MVEVERKEISLEEAERLEKELEKILGKTPILELNRLLRDIRFFLPKTKREIFSIYCAFPTCFLEKFIIPKEEKEAMEEYEKLKKKLEEIGV